MSTEIVPADDLLACVRAEHGAVIRAAIRKMVDEPDWDDVEADVWISIWTALQRFEGRSSLKTFIFPIVRRRIADHFREKYREARLMEGAQGQIKAEEYLPVAPASRAMGLISPAELRVLRCLADGKLNDQIGADLFISIHTVRSHIKSIYKKTKAADRASLALLAYRFFKEKTS